MVGFRRRSVMVVVVVVVATAGVVGRRASSDDCVYGHACSEDAKDGRGCCPPVPADAAAKRKQNEKPRPGEGAPRAAGARAAEGKAGARKPTEDATLLAADRALESLRSATCPAEMVHVPGGMFQMGSPAGAGDSDERPQHWVTLSGFCIDRTEVTVAAYAHCAASGRCTPAAAPAKDGWDSLCNGTRLDRRDHPVNCVDWDQARAYCAFVYKRLPSEAEWEYAARGSDGRRYPWGDEPPSAKRLNACGGECRALADRVNEDLEGVMYEDRDGWAATAPVGSFRLDASAFGVLDMAGNVCEWTHDWYGRYLAGSSTDPSGPRDGTARVVRGGSWGSLAAGVTHASYRSGHDPRSRHSLLGFRCVRAE